MNRYVTSALSLSLALLPASAAHGSPFTALTRHFHHRTSATPKPQRVLIVLDSQTVAKRRVQVGAVTYVLEPERMARFYVPLGTQVFARSTMRTHANGELLAVAGVNIGSRVVID